jgi:archaellum component FlaC
MVFGLGSRKDIEWLQDKVLKLEQEVWRLNKKYEELEEKYYKLWDSYQKALQRVLDETREMLRR